MLYNQGVPAPGIGPARPVQPTAKVRVLLADRYVLVRGCMKLLIEAHGDIQVVAEASNGNAAVQRATEFLPAVVLIEAALPLVSAVSATLQILRNAPKTKIMAFTATGDKHILRDMQDAGATCYAFESYTQGSLTRAIRGHADGGHGSHGSLSYSRTSRGATDGLSEREAAVLRRIAQGYTNKEIATMLGLSVKTVEIYKTHSMEKLELASRVDIMGYAVRQGWLQGGLGETENTA